MTLKKFHILVATINGPRQLRIFQWSSGACRIEDRRTNTKIVSSSHIPYQHLLEDAGWYIRMRGLSS